MVLVIGRERPRVWEYVVGEIEMRMWVVGLDAAGERPRCVTPKLPRNRRPGPRRRQQQSNENETHDAAVLVSCR